MKTIISILVILSPLFSLSQEYKVYKEDTNFYYYNGFVPELNNKLPDGKWMFYYLSKKDSNVKDVEKYLLIDCNYVDSLKSGPSYYYNIFSKGLKSTNVTQYTYSKGLLNGPFYEKIENQKTKEGYYKGGKKDGFFITYYNEFIDTYKIEFYKEDSLISWATYKEKMLSAKGENLHGLNDGEYFLFDDKGVLIYNSKIINNRYFEYKCYWNNGVVKTYATGEFESYYSNIVFDKFKELLPLKGVVKHFDGTGKLISEDKYGDR